MSASKQNWQNQYWFDKSSSTTEFSTNDRFVPPVVVNPSYTRSHGILIPVPIFSFIIIFTLCMRKINQGRRRGGGGGVGGQRQEGCGAENLRRHLEEQQQEWGRTERF
jgi:hypothetical protein